MEAILAAVVGLGVVAISPFTPGLRSVAKAVVSGTMAVAGATATAAAVAGEQWKDLVAEAKADRAAAKDAAELAAEAETFTIPAPKA